MVMEKCLPPSWERSKTYRWAWWLFLGKVPTIGGESSALSTGTKNFVPRYTLKLLLTSPDWVNSKPHGGAGLAQGVTRSAATARGGSASARATYRIWNGVSG